MIRYLAVSAGVIFGFIGIGIVTIAIIISAIYAFKKLHEKNEVIISVADCDAWVLALGGIENISEASFTSSRLTVVLKDSTKANKDLIKQLRPTSTMYMSSKLIIVTKDAQRICEFINSKLQQL